MLLVRLLSWSYVDISKLAYTKNRFNNRGNTMLEPIQLPSGKIVDLAKCIAIIPGSKSIDNEIILSGTEQQIQIDSIDLATLQQELKQRKNRGENQKRFNLERSPADESTHRQALAQKLQDFNSRWERLATDENAKQESDAFKQILDAERPSGQKLYSAE
jgi:hypothetical protein